MLEKKELLNWYTLYSWKKYCSSLFSNHYRFILWNGPYLNSSFQTFYHFQNYLSSKYCSHFFKDVHVKSVFFHWQPYIQFCPKTVFSCYFFFHPNSNCNFLPQSYFPCINWVLPKISSQGLMSSIFSLKKRIFIQPGEYNSSLSRYISWY